MVLLKLPPPPNFPVCFLKQDTPEQEVIFQPTHVCVLTGQPREGSKYVNSLRASVILSSNQPQIR